MDTLTLQEAIARVADAVRDGTPGVTTAASVAPNQFIDNGRKGIGKDKDWAGSQVLFLQPEASAAGIADNTAFDVSGYAANTTLFTLTRDVTNLSGVAQNVPYLLIRTRGQGHPYRSYIRALAWAVQKINPVSAVTYAQATAANVYTYAIPANVQGIYDVTATVQGVEYGLRPVQDWDVKPGRVLKLGQLVPVDYPLALTVSTLQAPTLPTTLLGTITCDADELIDAAAEYLQRGSMRPQDNQKAGNLQQERLRFNTNYVPANYVEVI